MNTGRVLLGVMGLAIIGGGGFFVVRELRKPKTAAPKLDAGPKLTGGGIPVIDKPGQDPIGKEGAADRAIIKDPPRVITEKELVNTLPPDFVPVKLTPPFVSPPVEIIKQPPIKIADLVNTRPPDFVPIKLSPSFVFPPVRSIDPGPITRDDLTVRNPIGFRGEKFSRF